MDYFRTYQCQQGCTVFRTIGLPSFCPHCGSKEVYETERDTTQYRIADEHYTNVHERTDS